MLLKVIRREKVCIFRAEAFKKTPRTSGYVHKRFPFLIRQRFAMGWFVQCPDKQRHTYPQHRKAGRKQRGFAYYRPRSHDYAYGRIKIQRPIVFVYPRWSAGHLCRSLPFQHAPAGNKYPVQRAVPCGAAPVCPIWQRDYIQQRPLGRPQHVLHHTPGIQIPRRKHPVWKCQQIKTKPIPQGKQRQQTMPAKPGIRHQHRRIHHHPGQH